MKATVMISMLENLVAKYGDHKVILRDGTEVRELSADFGGAETTYTVEPFGAAFWGSDCDSHEGRKDSLSDDPTSSDVNTATHLTT